MIFTGALLFYHFGRFRDEVRGNRPSKQHLTNTFSKLHDIFSLDIRWTYLPAKYSASIMEVNNMYQFSMTDSTKERFQKLLDYMNEREQEYRRLLCSDDAEDERNREWDAAELSSAKDVFDILNTCPHLHLVLTDDLKWTLQLDIEAFTYKEES